MHTQKIANLHLSDNLLCVVNLISSHELISFQVK